MARPRSALSTFVLSLPHDLPVKDVLAKVKSKGMKTSANNVYRIRRLAGKPAAIGKPSKRGRPRHSTILASAQAAAESLLRAVAAEIGFGRALTVLQEERQRVNSLIGA
jgi:hypothetical protein